MDISWPGGSWEATLQYAGLIVGTYLAAIWVTIIYWTFRDIRQRTRDGILQAFSVLLVICFHVFGLWIYMILRPRYTLSELYDRSLEEEALLQELEDQKACPTCRRRVKDDFLVCPSCRTQLKELCRSCSKPLSYAWNACPYCGLEKTPRTSFGQRPRPVERFPERSPERELERAAERQAPVRAAPVPVTPAAATAAPALNASMTAATSTNSTGEKDRAEERPRSPLPRQSTPAPAHDPFARLSHREQHDEPAVIDLTAD